MYNHHLITFLAVAEAGSFIKAGERLFISPNAVTKQINILEDHLGVRLFNRTHQGVTLTEEGKIIYDGAKKIISESNEIIEKAKAVEINKRQIIRVGVSMLHPADLLIEKWNEINKYHKNIELKIVPFSDADNCHELIYHLGNDFDVLVSNIDSLLKKDQFNTFHLADLKVLLAVPQGNPLSQYNSLKYEDLQDQDIILPRLGSNRTSDHIYEDIKDKCDSIHFEFVENYNFDVINKAVNENKLLLSNDNLRHVHPMLNHLKVDWDYTVPYGILYPLEPTKEVLSFVMALGRRR